jgi:hypothetical protein
MSPSDDSPNPLPDSLPNPSPRAAKNTAKKTAKNSKPSTPTARKPRQPRQPMPEYASCEKCGECARPALRMLRGKVVCQNCADRRHQPLRCAVCFKEAPGEYHHVASERQQPHFTIAVCLNCHAILSQKQRRWDPAWLRESHPVRCIIQGVLDVVALWLKRSPSVEPCRQLLGMLGQAFLLLVPYLRLDAFVDLHGVRLGGLGGAA